MSKTWYPIIDYDKCTGCLACFDKCSHGVYELNSRDFPKVVFPEGCVHGCTGCGSLCPQDAITYMGAASAEAKSEGCCGDDSDAGSGCCGGEAQEKQSGCGCGCGSSEDEGKKEGCCGDEGDSDSGCCGDEAQEKQSGCGCGCGCC